MWRRGSRDFLFLLLLGVAMPIEGSCWNHFDSMSSNHTLLDSLPVCLPTAIDTWPLAFDLLFTSFLFASILHLLLESRGFSMDLWAYDIATFLVFAMLHLFSFWYRRAIFWMWLFLGLFFGPEVVVSCSANVGSWWIRPLHLGMLFQTGMIFSLLVWKGFLWSESFYEVFHVRLPSLMAFPGVFFCRFLIFGAVAGAVNLVFGPLFIFSQNLFSKPFVLVCLLLNKGVEIFAVLVALNPSLFRFIDRNILLRVLIVLLFGAGRLLGGLTSVGRPYSRIFLLVFWVFDVVVALIACFVIFP